MTFSPSWSLVWSFASHRDLLWMPWKTAAKIDAAVMRFVATGEGAERASATNPRLLRVRVGGAEAHLCLDPETQTVAVMRVFRRD